MKHPITINKITGPEELEYVHEIRRQVYVIEQRCPPELEWEYEEESVHYLAKLDGAVCGTARWRKTFEGYKLERFAVLKPFRGNGVAHALVQYLLTALPADARYIYLHAQLTAVKLYEKSGFVQEGDVFEEAFIPHRKMVLHR